MRIRLCILAGFLALAVAGLDGPARAQMESREGIALQNQILELRNELQLLRSELGERGGASLGSRYPPPPVERGSAPNDMVAQLLNRVASLEEQVRRLSGRVDELANQIQRQGDLLNKQMGDLNFRLQTLEGGPGRATAAVPGPGVEVPAAVPLPLGPGRSLPPSSLGALPMMPPAPPPTPMNLPPNPEPGYESAGPLPLLPPPEPPEPAEAAPRAEAHTPEVALREGAAALGRRDYAAAESAARAVLASGRATLGAEAQFLLAEALAGERNYPQAALAYDDTYKRSRSGPHAQEALLGMANALANIGARPAACATLDRLRTEFLTDRAAIREAAAALRQREACRS